MKAVILRTGSGTISSRDCTAAPISAMSDLQEANGEIAGLKSKLESSEEGGFEKATKMDAIVSKRDSLVAKVKGLEAEMGKKEADIKGLESRIVCGAGNRTAGKFVQNCI